MIGSVTDVYYDDPGTAGTTKGVRARAFDYKPFGDTRTAVGAPITPAAYVPDTRFTGMVRDDATQYTIGVRTYQAQLGRFNQQDPIVRTRGKLQSQYGYVRNRPTVFTDPSGMTEEQAWGGGGLLSDVGQALGFNGGTEGENWTHVGTDTALCAAADVFQTGYDINAMFAWAGLVPSFDAKTWMTQHMGMNPCSAECATGDNWTAAAGAATLVAGSVGATARFVWFLGRAATGTTLLADAVRFGEMGASARASSVVNEGIYVVRTDVGTYVGQSGNIGSRLGQHVSSGKFTQAEVDAAERFAVPGGRTSREIAEQMKIDELGGVDNLINVVNPIGPRRLDLMPDGSVR